MAVMLKRELRDHLGLECPQLANVKFKFPVMRELIQHWCQSKVFFPQKPPMKVATVSTAARNSDVTVSAIGWHGSGHEKGHDKKKSREKRKGKRKGKGQGKKGKEKGREKSEGKSNSGKGKGNWWHEHHDQRWMGPFRGYCGHC